MAEGTLKAGWKVWRFDEMAVNVNKRIKNPSEAKVDYYIGLEHLDSESLKIRRWGSPSDVNATKLLFSNTVEALIRDTLCGKSPASGRAVTEEGVPYQVPGGVKWRYLPAKALPRQPQEVFVEPFVRQTLLRLKSTIAAQPERADEVLYKLRALVLAVRGEGLIRANEGFTGWLRNEQSMPFGRHHEHVTVKLIDYDNLAQNDFIGLSHRFGHSINPPDDKSSGYITAPLKRGLICVKSPF